MLDRWRCGPTDEMVLGNGRMVSRWPVRGAPVVYEDVRLDVGYRIDLIVNDCFIVELKAAEKLLAVHEAQLLTYLKLSGIRLGFLINFNVALLKQGIKRMVL